MTRLRHLDPKITVAVVFVLAMFMAIMDITIVNVALPTLAHDFHVRAASIGSVVVAFLVSLAVFIPASGWLGDRFGTKRVLLFALAVFTAASALCGLAESLGQLVLFRVLQGVGGGLLTPTGMAMLYRAFPPEERVAASRILTVPTAFAPALGPVVGGLLVTDLSWRWVFYVNVPIGLFAFVFGLLFLHENREHEPGRFDLPGFVLAGTGFASLMYALSEGPSRGWGSGVIVATALVGVVLITALVLFERGTRQPMLDFTLLARDRGFRTSTAVMFLGTLAFLGTLYTAALFFQLGLGASPLVSGLSTFPEALGVMAGAQVATRIYPLVGPRRIIAGGLCGVGATTLLMTLVGFETSLWWMRLLMFVLGLSMAHVFVPTQAAAFATITPVKMGRASTLFNAQRQLGSAVGVAVLTTVLAAVGTFHVVSGHLQPNLAAYHLAFVAAAGIAVVAALVSLFIRDEDAASTMVVRRRAAAGRKESLAADAVPA